MADSNSSLSSGKGVVPDLVPPSVPNSGRLQTVHTPVPGSLQESPAKGGNSSSKEAVKDQEEETKSPINFWAFDTMLFCHPPPPLNRLLSLSEVEETERYRDPLEWIYPDNDDYVEDWILSEGIDSD